MNMQSLAVPSCVGRLTERRRGDPTTGAPVIGHVAERGALESTAGDVSSGTTVTLWHRLWSTTAPRIVTSDFAPTGSHGEPGKAPLRLGASGWSR
jgi:hypothetical protein